MLDSKVYKFFRSSLYSLRRNLHTRRKFKRAVLNVDVEGNTATVHVGDKSFYLKSSIRDTLHHEVYDFALYGAAAIALSDNIELTCDLPISKSCQASLQEIYKIMRIWKPSRIFVQPLILTNIVEDPIEYPDKPGVMCMSGGIDSTFAAVILPEHENFTHGLLIAGADYRSPHESGYKELSSRVQNICTKLDKSLIEVETSIRELPLNWKMLHTLCLTMSLQFHSSVFGKGAFAADLTYIQEIIFGPWGNTGPMASALSLPYFPIQHIGATVCRHDKVKGVVEDPRNLLEDVSVCFSDTSIGGNCGHCRKCIRTMLSLHSLGVEYSDYFIEHDLVSLVKTLKIPKSHAFRKVVLSWGIEELDRMPDGDVKRAFSDYISEMSILTLPGS